MTKGPQQWAIPLSITLRRKATPPEPQSLSGAHQQGSLKPLSLRWWDKEGHKHEEDRGGHFFEQHKGSGNPPLGTKSPIGAVSAPSYRHDVVCKIKRQERMSVGLQREGECVCPGHQGQGNYGTRQAQRYNGGRGCGGDGVN